MASILHADLPSEDEEDDNYDPSKDKTAEPEDRVSRPKRKTDGPGRRGLAAATAPLPSAAPSASQLPPADLRRSAKAASAFEKLKAQAAAPRPRPASTAVAPTLALRAAAPSRKRPAAADSDLLWMRSLGLAPPAKLQRPADELVAAVLSGCTTRRRPVVEESVAYEAPAAADAPQQPAPPAAVGAAAELDTPAPHVADAEADAVGAVEELGGGAEEQAAAEPPGPSGALDMAKIAASALANVGNVVAADAARKAGTVTIVEKRRFAGQDVQIAREMKAGTKAAEAAAAKAAVGDSGLDAVLSQITGPRKANVMDKTRDDWSGFKQTNKDVNQELEQYNKSGDKYLDKKAFLQKAELAEYEKERDARLGADMRSRGRL